MPRVIHSRLLVVITPKLPRLLSAKVLQSGVGRDAPRRQWGRHDPRIAREVPSCSFGA